MTFKRDHFIVGTRSSASSGTPTDRFRLLGSGGVTYDEPSVISESEESGHGSGLLATALPLVVRRGWTKDLDLYPDNHSLLYWFYKAGAGTAATVATQISTGGVYRHVWTGPAAAISASQANLIRTIGALHDVADPTHDDNNMNVKSTQVVIERAELKLVRGAAGALTANLRGASTVTVIGGVPGAGTNFRSGNIYGAPHGFLYTSLDLTPKVANYANTGSSVPSAANSCVGTTVVDAGALNFAEITLRVMNPVDVEASYLGANSVGVLDGGYWVRAADGQHMEIEFLIDADTNDSGALAGISGEHAARTRRGWELWMHDGTNIADTGTAYPSTRITLPVCIPIGKVTVESGDRGRQYLRLAYMTAWDATAGIGWRVEATIRNSLVYQ